MNVSKLIDVEQLALAGAIISDYTQGKEYILRPLDVEDLEKQGADAGWFYIEGYFNLGHVVKEGEAKQKHIAAQQLALDNLLDSAASTYSPLLDYFDVKLQEADFVTISDSTRSLFYRHLADADVVFSGIVNNYISRKPINGMTVEDTWTLTVTPYTQLLVKNDTDGGQSFNFTKCFIVEIMNGEQSVAKTVVSVK